MWNEIMRERRIIQPVGKGRRERVGGDGRRQKGGIDTEGKDRDSG